MKQSQEVRRAIYRLLTRAAQGQLPPLRKGKFTKQVEVRSEVPLWRCYAFLSSPLDTGNTFFWTVRCCELEVFSMKIKNHGTDETPSIFKCVHGGETQC